MSHHITTPITKKLELTNCLPPLLQAVEIKRRMIGAGFGALSLDETLAKLDEEILELKQEIARREKDNSFEEAGDVLFILANLISNLGHNPMLALEATNKKMISRFKYIEENMIFRGASFTEHSDFANQLYEEAKAKEKQKEEVIKMRFN